MLALLCKKILIGAKAPFYLTSFPCLMAVAIIKTGDI